MVSINVNAKEHATILSALRFYQEKKQFNSFNRTAEINEIATNCGEFSSLTSAGIDALSHQINECTENTLSNIDPVVVVEMDCGAIHGVRSSLPVQVLLLDLDIEGSNGESIGIVNGSKYYISDYNLTSDSTLGFKLVDVEYVSHVVTEIDNNSFAES